MTEGGEIAFRVYHKSSDNNKVELVPMNKVESHLFIEEGQLICEFLGLCKYYYTTLIPNPNK